MKLRMSIAKKRLSGLTMRGFQRGGSQTSMKLPKIKLPKRRQKMGAC